MKVYIVWVVHIYKPTQIFNILHILHEKKFIFFLR